MPLNCITISPDVDFPLRSEGFFHRARFLEVIGQFTSLESAFAFVQKHEVDYLIVDLSLAIEAIATIKTLKEAPEPRIIILGPEEYFFMHSGELAEIPKTWPGVEHQGPSALGNSVNLATLPLPASQKGPKRLQLFAKMQNIPYKPVWLLLDPTELTYSEFPTILYVRSESGFRRVPVLDVVFVEAQRNYLLLHTAKESFRVQKSMKDLETKLNPVTHVRVHKSYIVQIAKIHTINRENLFVDGMETQIPLGAKYRQTLLDSIDIL